MKKENRKIAVHRLLTLALCLLLAVTLTPTAHADGTVAVKSSQPIYIDNLYSELTMYNINGNNYVRLRDVGMAVDFDVYFDRADGTIHIFTDQPYSGGLFTIGAAPDRAEVTEAQITVYVDGWQKSLTAYNIGGNNYAKLREIGAAVNFGVDWDAANGRVLVNTSKPYTPEAGEVVSAPAMTIEEMKAEIIRLTNEERVKAGVPELEVLPALMDCAQAKAQDFLDNHYYGHDSPVYGTPGEMIMSAIPGVVSGAENIAPWSKTPEEAFAGWLISSAHLKNLLNPKFSHIGVGIVEGADGGFWWVQQFIQK